MNPLRASLAAEFPAARAADWLVLVRPRIASFVFIAALVGALLGAGPGSDLARAMEAALWIACVASSASVFNQVLEVDVDRLMPRTQDRPLAAGRMQVRDAVGLGAFLATAGGLGLALRFNPLAACLGLGALVAYALVYTPLKRLSTLNTVFGALPGAAPPLIGFVAVSGAPHAWGWFLFAVVFTWQFPHFMAIAWLYRQEYAHAGLKMLPALEGCEAMAARQALAYSLVLIALSLVPATQGAAGSLYVVGAVALGLAYAGASLAFALQQSRSRARALLLTSLVYLPLFLSVLLFDPVVRLTSGPAVP